METTFWTFSLNVPFATWAAMYDSEDEAKMHDAVGIKSIFRGISKDYPSKICAIQQAPIGVAQKIFKDNKKMIHSTVQIIESTTITVYS